MAGLGHDDRARQPQPVASLLGPRFYDFQLSQSAEESWEECRRHAENIRLHLVNSSPVTQLELDSIDAEGIFIKTSLLKTEDEEWIPEMPCLADYGLGHDKHACRPHPVAPRLGPRFYDFRLSQSAEESREECRRHAENIRRIRSIGTPRQDVPVPPEKPFRPGPSQPDLFGPEQGKMFVIGLALSRSCKKFGVRASARKLRNKERAEARTPNK